MTIILDPESGRLGDFTSPDKFHQIASVTFLRYCVHKQIDQYLNMGINIYNIVLQVSQAPLKVYL